ncbi:MAG TPA: histidine phosphatase family protein [Acidimicrobiales bacterium]|nr:histidine phosphatase family protein [Acidimicrobiales bacterium]
MRHGESERAVAGSSFALLDGHGDPALAPEGRRQAEQVCARLAEEGVESLVVTPLRRTAETAAPLVRRLGLSPAVEPGLREVHLGEWEGGLYRAKVLEGDPVARRVFDEQRWDAIPGAETNEAFFSRVRAAVERVALANAGRRVAVFAHGGTIGAVLAMASGSQPFAFVGADNASISEVVVTPGRWFVRRYNDTAHVRAEPSA